MAASNEFGAGFRELFNTIPKVLKSPLRFATWLVALVVSYVAAIVWGSIFAAHGWLEARKKLQSDGVTGVGEVLLPAPATEQFKDGVWTGFWRVHALGVAFVFIQLPTLMFAFAPAMLARFLLKPFEQIIPNAGGLVLAWGIPSLVALACFVVVTAEGMLSYRVIVIGGPKYSIGLVANAVAVAWKRTLQDFTRLMGLATALVLSAAVVGGVLYGCIFLAGELEWSNAATQLVLSWIGLAFVAVFAATVLETLAAWADAATPASLKGTGYFSFTAWLRAWLGSVFGWFAAQGIVAVGIGVCLVVGALTAVGALATGQVFTSWVGLGWFAVTATVLVALRWRGE